MWPPRWHACHAAAAPRAEVHPRAHSAQRTKSLKLLWNQIRLHSYATIVNGAPAKLRRYRQANLPEPVRRRFHAGSRPRPAITIGSPRPFPRDRFVNQGVLIALLAYASFSWHDAAVKSLSGQLSVFAIGFFSSIFAGLAILVLARPRDGRWRDFWRMRRPWAVQARALTGVSAGLLGIYALTTIPLAEAYALIFLAPLIVTILSGLALGEEIGPWRWLAVIVGFAGVLLVVRPGFRAIHPGHVSAFGVALSVALSVILMRSLAGGEKRTSILGTLILYAVTVQGTAVLVTGPALPNPSQLAWIAVAGTFGGLGQIGLLAATRRAPASAVAPMHYSQIAWAILLGALFFGEYPDLLAAAGLAVIAAAGLLTVLRERSGGEATDRRR
jgi:drug/metabolite transporter (DMT)-like permease